MKSNARMNRIIVSSLSTITVIAVVVVMLGATSSAHADSPRISFRISIGDPGCAAPVVVHQPVPVCSIDFERGLRAGEHDGYEEGFRDGLFANRFCDALRFDFCRASREFERGYRAAYGKAYRSGFESGSRERCLHHDRCDRDDHRDRARDDRFDRDRGRHESRGLGLALGRR